VPAAPPKSSSPAAQQATSSPSPSPSNSFAPAAPPAPSTPSAPQANQIIARFNGSNDQNTPSFTTPANWHLSWSYWGCSGGGPSNFAVTEYNADGSIDSSGGVLVNELGTGRGPVATYVYGDAGTHYFQVVSECSWSLVPVTG
jgi:hypothetical protein